MKQVLALLAAVAMIGGAYVVRTQVLDDGAASTDGQEQAEPITTLDVACDDRLDTACPTGSTQMDVPSLIAAFTDPSTAPDVVVAPDTVVAMILESGQARVTFTDERPTVATSPIVLLGSPATVEALEADCGTVLTWSCTSSAVTAGGLRPAFADPARTSDGIAGLAALAGGYFTEATTPFNTTGFSTGGFIGWLDAVRRESMISTAPAANLVRFNGAQNDSAIVTEAAALDVAGSGGAQAMGLRIAYPTPLASFAVVVAGTAEADSGSVDDIADQVRDALLADGWRGPDGSSDTAEAPDIPSDSGLPSGGVLVALQQRWS